MIIKNIRAFVNKQSRFSGRVGIFLLLFSQFSFAQDKKDNIGTEVVNVVKPYTPTISDAFKIKEVPVITTDENAKKEIVKYSILPFPVASTFSPSKGNAQSVEKAKQDRLFKNYATLGIGNYGAFNAELYVNEDLNNNEYIGGMFRHNSSQGGIKDITLDDFYYDTKIDLIYGSNEQEMSWNVKLGYQNQIYNWYGLPADFGNTLTLPESMALVNGINPQQSYNTITAGGNLAFEEGIVNDVNLQLIHFSDAFSSSENRFLLAPTFKFDVMDEAIKTKVFVDYVDGSFKKNYLETNTADIKYGFTNLGIVPSFVMKRDDWTIDIGAGLVYSMGKENNTNKFYIYPSVTASYKVVGDLMIFYASAVGNLQQNTYQDFVDGNPFVSPTLYIKPTNELYDVHAGLKGKLTSTVSYDIKACYIYDENKALFKSNDYNEKDTNANYAFGNSFQVIYDDMKIMRLYGEIKADLMKGVTVEADATINSYTNKTQSEAWNLPELQLNSKVDFAVTDKWFAGINLFYVGERKDQQLNTNIVYVTAPGPITLDGYFDLNANVRFKYSERFTTFLKANNIMNNGYQKWLNYPVQGFQVMLGANYKFDF
ncbi:TonB-dependent receptor [Flavobacterium taihuense]|uniref:TonB-dependent receptor n=1 Tax=Flavobacterium taihuense TaxID=2857508 RepID=A0ABS6XZ59_9FLAO|nr:TonB-dependent receptor [Flavobacterium taihuense]MBW4361657.1 TonB-dependent receptor [Flavobacterium taihuense]